MKEKEKSCGMSKRRTNHQSAPKSDTDPKIQHLEHIENIKSLFLLVYLRRADGACFAQENTPVKRATAKQNCVKKIQVQECGY